MRLIAMHKEGDYSSYIEGFHKKHGCITLWNDPDELTQTFRSYLTHTYENRVCKGTNPFIE